MRKKYGKTMQIWELELKNDNSPNQIANDSGSANAYLWDVNTFKARANKNNARSLNISMPIDEIEQVADSAKLQKDMEDTKKNCTANIFLKKRSLDNNFLRKDYYNRLIAQKEAKLNNKTVEEPVKEKFLPIKQKSHKFPKYKHFRHRSSDVTIAVHSKPHKSEYDYEYGGGRLLTDPRPPEDNAWIVPNTKN